MKKPSLRSLRSQVEEWNTHYPIGTEVVFHPVIGRELNTRIRKTRTEAQILGDHTAIVFLDGESGCVALDACTPIPRSANAENPQPASDLSEERQDKKGGL